MYPINTVTYTSLFMRNCSYAIFHSLQYHTTLTIVSKVLQNLDDGDAIELHDLLCMPPIIQFASYSLPNM